MIQRVRLYFCRMKALSAIVLFIFVLFISTPTIVSVIEKGCDVSAFYSMSEEELTHKEIKGEVRLAEDFHFINLSGNTSGLILSENLSKHDNVFSSIFIPPPEQA